MWRLVPFGWLGLVATGAAAASVAGCRRPPRAPDRRAEVPDAVAQGSADAPSAGSDQPAARVFRVETPGDLLDGPFARGRIGDVRMDNAVVAFIIEGMREDPWGFAGSGGNVIDAAALPEGRDELAQIVLFLDGEFPRQAVYRELAIGVDDGGAALARAIGLDAADPRIEIETLYVLEPGARALRIETTAANRGDFPVPSYEIGDAILWGAADPLFGRLPAGEPMTSLLAAVGPTASYAYLPAERKPFGYVAGRGWTDTILAVADLPPRSAGARAGAAHRVVRYLAVGDRADTASATAAARSARGEETARVVGRAVDPAGEPVPDAVLRLAAGPPAPPETVRADGGGRFEARLPPGSYAAAASAPGRGERDAPAVTVPAPRPFEAALSGSGRLDVDVNVVPVVEGDAKSVRAPVRVIVRGTGGTPDPDFGGPFDAAGSGNEFVVVEGRASHPVPPGEYDVLVTRGPEYDVIEERVEVPQDGAVVVRGTLARRIDPAGYIAVDPHVHTAASADSGMLGRDRALACAAEGIQAVIVTDHNVVIGLGAEIEALGLASWLSAVPGVEVTTDLSGEPVGHLSVFPLRVPAGGSGPGPPLPWRDTGFRQIVASAIEVPGAVVGVNHPRATANGAFALLGLDTATFASRGAFSADFHALEIITARTFGDLDAVAADWAALVTCGRRVVPTAGSDSHRMAGEVCGFPRTYVHVGADRQADVAPASVAAGMRSGRVVATTGPFVAITVNGVPSGGTVTTAARGVLVHLRVEAAPWVDVRRIRVMVNGVEKLAFAPTSRPPEPVRLEVQQPVALTGDAAIWAEVTGDDPLETLDPASPIRPWALTGAVWVDLDRDGTIRPPGDRPCP